MADIKKIALNSIVAPKKEKKSKSVSKTVRFLLTLGESNEKSCPEFNYKELLAVEGNKIKSNGVLPLDDDEDEARLRALARKYEEKYGGVSSGGGKRKKKRSEDYVDLGAGYDDNDSFIDNTDAYDEIVPEEMTTAQGGFYINCGKLEYKQLEIPDEPNVPSSDNEEVQNNRKRSKGMQQALVSSGESSDDEDDEDDDEDSRDEELPSEQETTPQVTPVSKPLPVAKPLEESRKLKRAADSPLPGPSKKKTSTVKDLLKEKRDHTVVEIKEVTAPAPNPVAPSLPDLPSKVLATSSSIADSIESVISAAYSERPPPAAVSEKPVEPLKLPDDLSESVKSQAEFLRRLAEEVRGINAKFFTSSVDRSLIRLHQKTQNLPNAIRYKVFAYIAEQVVCSPEALMKKAQKLTLLREKARSKDSINKLKAAIEQLTPTVMELHQEKCARKFLEQEDLQSPTKIFPFTNELRSGLREAITLAATMDDEKGLRSFLENKIFPLFPNGWMSLSTLEQEAQALISRPKDIVRATVVSTPSSPPQRSTSVITLAESPRLSENSPRSTQHVTPISLKQRILQDAVGGAFKQDDVSLSWQSKTEIKPAGSGAIKQEDISLPWQVKIETPQITPSSFAHKTDTTSLPKPGKSNGKEKKPSSKQSMPKPERRQDTSKNSKGTNVKKKWASFDITEIPMKPDPPPPPPPPPPPITHDDLEDKNKKLIEETNAATDYLSQIIHESLSGFPNAETNKEDHLEYQPRERKISETRQGRQTPEPPGLDPEVSVQLEMNRVLQELMELNGQMSAASEPPKLSPVHDRLKGRSIESPARSPERSPYEGGRSRVDKARSLNSSHINNEVSITPSSHSIYGTAPPDQRTSEVSVIAVNQSRNMNPIYGGFQEEFQRHLRQEPPDVVVSSSPSSVFRPSPSRQQTNPYSSFSQPLLPAEDFRTSYYNQVHQHLNNHGRIHHQYPDLQPK